jgi:lipopolysaccharide/colanic/teichoic acid biosynthesis glycosyltransferase
MSQTPENPYLHAALLRLFDLVCSVTGLLLLLPVFLAIGLLVLLDDGPPVFFCQPRAGRNGRLFRMWKFRTMRTECQGNVITAAGDHRITRVGAWLRKLKLDELPQLFNVLKGDMSLVGPRPEVPQFVEPESQVWQAVLDVRPGITDLASLIYRDEEKILATAIDPISFYRDTVLPSKLLLNVRYQRSRSFLSDLKLILLTIRYSLFPQSFEPNRVARELDAEIEPDDVAMVSATPFRD